MTMLFLCHLLLRIACLERRLSVRFLGNHKFINDPFSVGTRDGGLGKHTDDLNREEKITFTKVRPSEALSIPILIDAAVLCCK